MSTKTTFLIVLVASLAKVLVATDLTELVMPVVDVKPEYLNLQGQVLRLESRSVSNSSYVFLQKFPLKNFGGIFFHTEVLVCPMDGFSKEDREFLDSKISSLTDFVELDKSWWSTRTSPCVELGYGSGKCSDRCCAVPHGNDQVNYPLNAQRSMIQSSDDEKKSVFLYGSGNFDGNEAYHYVCDHKCWSDWAGTNYNPITNNCNTFTSTVLFCVFGLSEKKPHLGPSDMVTVKCHCAPSAESDEGLLSMI